MVSPADYELFLDLRTESLKKHGEELCGDTVKTARTDDKLIAVLSDGLGSGVKASILATLTAEILVKLFQENVPLEAVIETVIGTLPICKVRKIAYATFTVLQVDQRTGEFQVINFDNPPPFHFQSGKLVHLPLEVETVLGRKIGFARGTMRRGDFLGAISDGVCYAGLGVQLNFGWGWPNIARFLESSLLLGGNYSEAVRRVMEQTRMLYHDLPGDDATFLGVWARRRNALMVFTGPPLDPAQDAECAQRLLCFPGRRVVCGGTTSEIVATQLGEPVRINLTSLRRDVPPIGHLSQVEFCTEGVITMSRCCELLTQAGGRPGQLPTDPNGAVRLAQELLQADYIHFLVGQKVNEFYQSPLLPSYISFRRSLVEKLAQFLTGLGKQVDIDYC